MTIDGDGMERADWLDGHVNPADARFLMATAITHHRFSSPIWGAREVRKLQAELAEITKDSCRLDLNNQPAGRQPVAHLVPARRLPEQQLSVPRQPRQSPSTTVRVRSPARSEPAPGSLIPRR
jgi:hypothetical protein